MFTLRHIQPLQFVQLPISLLVLQHRFRIVDSGGCRLALCHQPSNGYGLAPSPSIFHIPGRTSQEPCPQTMDEILQQSSMKWLKQGRVSKNTLSWMHNILESPNVDVEFSSPLALILQPPSDVPTRYYLSAKACQGILRRANRRGKVLPPRLQQALEQVANGGTVDK